MSVADAVTDYVDARPYLQEALAEEIVNFSALARRIEEEVDGGFDAVKMALRRHAEELKEERGRRAETVADILAGSAIELKGGCQVCKTDTVQEGLVSATTKHGATTVQEATQDCHGEVIPDQVMITVKSPAELEHAPGVLAYILSLLAGHKINVTECISCREDTHIVVHEDNATAAFELLNEKLT